MMYDKVHGGSLIRTGISNRHIHLSRNDLELLFGPGYRLTKIKELSQPGQFAAVERVTIIGPRDSIRDVRILGPERKETQVEVSRTDMYKLGVQAPVRDSGDIEGSPGVMIIGPKGVVQLVKGVICAKRHIHMTSEDARHFNVWDKQEVRVKVLSQRGLIFENVLIRVDDSFALEFHVDTDEANAAWLNNGDMVEIIR